MKYTLFNEIDWSTSNSKKLEETLLSLKSNTNNWDILLSKFLLNKLDEYQLFNSPYFVLFSISLVDDCGYRQDVLNKFLENFFDPYSGGVTISNVRRAHVPDSEFLDDSINLIVTLLVENFDHKFINQYLDACATKDQKYVDSKFQGTYASHKTLSSHLKALSAHQFERYVGRYIHLFTDYHKMKLYEDFSSKEFLFKIAKNWKFESHYLTKEFLKKYYKNLRGSHDFLSSLKAYTEGLDTYEDLKDIYTLTNKDVGLKTIAKRIDEIIELDKIRQASYSRNYSSVIGEYLRLDIPDKLKVKILENLSKKNQEHGIPSGFEDMVTPDIINKSRLVERILEGKIFDDSGTYYIVYKITKDERLLQELLNNRCYAHQFIDLYKNYPESRNLLQEWINKTGYTDLVGYNNKWIKLLDELEGYNFQLDDIVKFHFASAFTNLRVLIDRYNSNKLNEEYFDGSFVNFIDKLLEYGLDNISSLYVIVNLESRKIIEKALLKFDYDSDADNHYFGNFYHGLSFDYDFFLGYQNDFDWKDIVNLIKNESLFKRISRKVALDVLNKIGRHHLKVAIDISESISEKFKNKFLNGLEPNENNFSQIVNHLILESSEAEFSHIERSSDIFILIEFLKEPTEPEYIIKINQVLRKNSYSFQLQLYKYLTFLKFKNQLSGEELKELLRKIEGNQLSALLYRFTILNPKQERNQLMNSLNLLLKQHFALLKKDGLESTTFQQIFSLTGLVNPCNGRKQIEDGWFANEDGTGKYYVDSTEYLTFTEYENLDIYCEGRFWKSTPIYDSKNGESSGRKCNVYWCRNKVCMGVNDSTHFDKSFENWTLNDVNELFNLGLDQLAFSHIAGWLNRMNSIFDSLNCRTCKNLLRPLNFVPNQLGYYAVPLFQCVNHSCVKFEKKIRFTHCRGCRKILDSRDCKTCSDCNWLICDDSQCGQCGCGADHNPRYVQYPEA